MKSVKRFNRAKRAIDLALLFASSPISLPSGLVVAAYVRVSLGSPVLFRQARIGLGGKEFSVLKFRTMTGATDRNGLLLPDSQRLTAVGRALRRLSLDEIPQLWNVLRGDMALVGPRPLFPRYVPHYSPGEARRHLVRPGITGLAQTSGRNSVGWDERLRLDREYVDMRRLRIDLNIYAKTLRQVATGQDISVLASDSGEPLDVERSYPRDPQVALRRLRRADLSTRVEWMGHESTRAFMQIPDGLNLETTLKWFEQSAGDSARHDFVVFDRRTGAALAMAGLKFVTPGTYEFYVFVSPDRRSEGVGRAASELVFRWARSSDECKRITLSVSTGNVSAMRIYEEAGFEAVSFDADRLRMQLDLEVLGNE